MGGSRSQQGHHHLKGRVVDRWIRGRSYQVPRFPKSRPNRSSILVLRFRQQRSVARGQSPPERLLWVDIFAFPGNFPIETLTMWSLTHRDHRQEDTCLARDTGDEDARDYARWSYQESRLCRHKGIHRWQH